METYTEEQIEKMKEDIGKMDPVGFIYEYEGLEWFVEPKIYIDALCPVTTPFDKECQKVLKSYINNGTCGVGFGSTIQREEDYYHLQFIDLFYPKILRSKLKSICSYYESEQVNLIEFFIQICEFIKRKSILVFNKPENYSKCIYEGAQGLLLDQHFGFFPNVTRSNTGCKNLEEICGDDYELYYVTRSYQTRHGNGFMTNKNIPHSIIIDPNETNKENQQGKFRRSVLDLSLLEYAHNSENLS